jgi:arylformamidase
MIIDISQEVFSCRVYPGDPAPERRVLSTIEESGICNLTALSMCAHNGTHVDAPSHFIRGGKTIDRIPLDVFTGPCWVARHEGEVSGADAAAILEKAKAEQADRRILIAGKATVTGEAAQVFADYEVMLLGNESQTVGPEDAPMQVHLILLGAGCVLLEGVVLDGVEEGVYCLHAAPLNLGGSDGAPCRAYLTR